MSSGSGQRPGRVFSPYEITANQDLLCPPAADSFLRLSLLVAHHRERRRGCAAAGGAQQEALAIVAHFIAAPNNKSIHHWHGKQGLRLAHLKRFRGRTSELHGNRHERPIFRDIEQLCSVLPPLRLHAAARGNWELRARHWKRLHVDFVPARFVRAVGHPATVEREAAVPFIELRLQIGKRLAVAALTLYRLRRDP